MKNIQNQVPAGFSILLKGNIPKRIGIRQNENVCHWCDARKLCQENKNNWCGEYPCMAYSRNDGKSIIFKQL